MKNSQKGYIVTIGILILALVAVGGYIYYYNIKKGVINDYPVPSQTIAPTSTTEQSSVSEWRTYKNDEYKFTIEHPADWPVILSKNILTIGSIEPDPVDNHTTCYLTVEFQGSRSSGQFIPTPHKYNNYHIQQIERGETCDVTLNKIISSFKLDEI